MRRMRHVAILIETSRAYGRGLLAGIARFNRVHGHWSTYFQPQGLGDAPPSWLRQWRGDGILARIENRRMARAVLAAKVPVINLRGAIPDLRVPFLGADNREVARLAAVHLLDRGYRNFAYCGFRREFRFPTDRRAEWFAHFVHEAGHACDIFAGLLRGRPPRTWEEEQEALANWIGSLAKPVGVMAAHDDRGLQILDACRRIGAAVPDEVAVVGVDNDEYLCNLAIPPLSSIDINSQRTGYLAAVYLDRMMSGKRVPRRLAEVKPRGVVARRSTDWLAIDDPDLALAVRFIRQNACRPVTAGQVIAHSGVSRASLEPRFKRALGRTIHAEIQRVKIDRAQTLLAATDMPIKQVAQAAGFTTVQYLSRVFHAAVGQTPAAFRRASK